MLACAEGDPSSSSPLGAPSQVVTLPIYLPPYPATVQDRGGCTVRDFCDHIHRGLLKDVKYVLCWGTSVKHYPQRCGLPHVLQDEDVVQIVKKKVNVVKEKLGAGWKASMGNRMKLLDWNSSVLCE